MNLYKELNTEDNLRGLAGRHGAIHDISSSGLDSIEVEFFDIPIMQNGTAHLDTVKNDLVKYLEAIVALNELCANNNLAGTYDPKKNIVIISRK